MYSGNWKITKKIAMYCIRDVLVVKICKVCKLIFIRKIVKLLKECSSDNGATT